MSLSWLDFQGLFLVNLSPLNRDWMEKLFWQSFFSARSSPRTARWPQCLPHTKPILTFLCNLKYHFFVTFIILNIITFIINVSAKAGIIWYLFSKIVIIYVHLHPVSTVGVSRKTTLKTQKKTLNFICRTAPATPGPLNAPTHLGNCLKSQHIILVFFCPLDTFTSTLLNNLLWPTFSLCILF